MHCTRNGTVQAYNCQLPRADDGLVLAARATQDANDAAQVEPTLAAITAAGQVIAAGHQAGGTPRPGRSSAPSPTTPGTSARTTAPRPARIG